MQGSNLVADLDATYVLCLCQDCRIRRTKQALLLGQPRQHGNDLNGHQFQPMAQDRGTIQVRSLFQCRCGMHNKHID